METLSSVWVHDPCDLSEKRQQPTADCEAQCDSGLMWSQLSPNLQRNKQLQDWLLQKEEELAVLQEENHQLRKFLGSDYVRNLEENNWKLGIERKRKLKRNQMCFDDRPLYHLQTSQQISKRICRNLTAEFCSESRTPEPNLDLWVLQTLGLKDRDTIDMSTGSSPLSQGSGSTVFCSPSAGNMSHSSLCSSVSASTPSSVQSHCQSSNHQTDYSYDSTESTQSNENTCEPASSAHNPDLGLCSHMYATPDASVHVRAKPNQDPNPDASVQSYNTSTAFQCPTLTNGEHFSPSTDRVGVCPPISWGQLLEEHPSELGLGSNLKFQGCRTWSRDTIQFSPSGWRCHLSPIGSSSPTWNPPQLPLGEDSLTSPSMVSQTPHTPQNRPSTGSQSSPTPKTPRCRTDLAFSMSLSPSSSVKTHSFPQGQAFVRKDTQGTWSFTWVPRRV